MPKPSIADLKHRFAHHPPYGDRGDRHGDVRQACFDAAEKLVDATPEGREQALALTKLEEAMFWANAAIARQVKQPHE